MDTTLAAPMPAPLVPHQSGLSDYAKSLAGASISTATRRAYGAALQHIQAATQGQVFAGDAAHRDTALAEYLAAQHAAGLSPATVSMGVAAVRCAARMMGQPSPAGIATARVLAGIRREGAGRGRGQVAGIRWEQADAAAAAAAVRNANGNGSLQGLRDAALFGVMSDGLLRGSEAAALTVADIETEGANTITIRRSKTDQEGQGAALFISDNTRAALKRWLAAASIETGAVFRRVLKGGSKVGSAAITPRAIRSIIQARARQAGISGRISGHSLRVGAAQSLAAAGASVVEMQTAGRWQSPSMPGRYARGQLAARGAVARFRYGI